MSCYIHDNLPQPELEPCRGENRVMICKHSIPLTEEGKAKGGCEEITMEMCEKHRNLYMTRLLVNTLFGGMHCRRCGNDFADVSDVVEVL